MEYWTTSNIHIWTSAIYIFSVFSACTYKDIVHDYFPFKLIGKYVLLYNKTFYCTVPRIISEFWWFPVLLWLINIPYIKKQKKIGYFYWDDMIWFGLGLWFMVCNATFYNSSVISWRSVWWWRKPEYTVKTRDLSCFVLNIFELCLTMSFFYLSWSSVFHLLLGFDNILLSLKWEYFLFDYLNPGGVTLRI